MNINDLKIGKQYNNEEIMNIFKCANAGGMRRSHRTNTLVLIFDHNKMYDDNWEDNVLHYTGMGKNRDQVLDGNQNRTLYESRTNGVELHLFEVFQKGRYEYIGPVELADEPYQDTQRDEQGVLRRVWMFPLKRK